MANGLLNNIGDALVAFGANTPRSEVRQGRVTRNLLSGIQDLPEGQVLDSDELRQLQLVNPAEAKSIGDPLRALDQQRKEAFFTDALRADKLLEGGFNDKTVELLQNRIADIGTLGGDVSDTQEILDVLQSQGPEAARQLLEPTLIMGRFGGFLPKDAVVSALDQAKIAKLEAETIQLGVPPARTGKETQTQINELRKGITAAGKDFNKVEAARNRILRSGNKGTAASDISLIFNFMKMNDPGSTVREGEFATAQNATGVPGRVVALYNNLIEGTRLSPPQRDDFITQSENLFDAQRESFDSAITRTLDFADQDNIPRARVLGAKRLAGLERRIGERERIAAEDAAAQATGQQDAPGAIDLSTLSLEELIQLRQQQGTP